MGYISSYADARRPRAENAQRCEPLWRYNDLARALPPRPVDEAVDAPSPRTDPAARFLTAGGDHHARPRR